jgi:hypothetical protein
MCHHEIAPKKAVVADGRLQGTIDRDLIGPGTTR